MPRTVDGKRRGCVRAARVGGLEKGAAKEPVSGGHLDFVRLSGRVDGPNVGPQHVWW